MAVIHQAMFAVKNIELSSIPEPTPPGDDVFTLFASAGDSYDGVHISQVTTGWRWPQGVMATLTGQGTDADGSYTEVVVEAEEAIASNIFVSLPTRTIVPPDNAFVEMVSLVGTTSASISGVFNGGQREGWVEYLPRYVGQHMVSLPWWQREPLEHLRPVVGGYVGSDTGNKLSTRIRVYNAPFTLLPQ